MKVDIYRADGSIEVAELANPRTSSPTKFSQSKSVTYVLRQLLNGVSIETDDQKIRASGLYEKWAGGSYSVGDIRNANNQTWECFQAHNTADNPDIIPDNPAWFTFWRPLHGKSLETARFFVPVQGSHDMYRSGEYMIYTDGLIYKCLSDTNFSPDEYAQAWEVHDG